MLTLVPDDADCIPDPSPEPPAAYLAWLSEWSRKAALIAIKYGIDYEIALISFLDEAAFFEGKDAPPVGEAVRELHAEGVTVERACVMLAELAGGAA